MRRSASRCERPAENRAGVRVAFQSGEHGEAMLRVSSARPMTRGRLITIEGIDGAGKSTLATALARDLRQAGVEIELLREPGGVVLSERIRTLVKDPALRVDPAAEALLYAAARAQLVAERVRPALDAGRWILLDRFVDSSLAYQGAARGLGVEEVRAVNMLAVGGLVPDRTLLLRIDPAQARSRQADRGEAADRLEQEPDAFFVTIAAAYDTLAAAEPNRFAVLDASVDPASLLADAHGALADLLTPSDPR